MAELTFDSRVNYQKIYLNGTVSLTVSDPSSSNSTIIVHGLGYYPNVKLWYTDANGNIATAVTDAGSYLYPVTSAFANRGCYYTVNTNSLTITLDRGITSGTAVTSTIYYRIYIDAS